MYADVISDQKRCNLTPTNIYVSDIKYQKYQQNIEGNSNLECENAKIFQARSHIHRFFLNISVLSYCQ